MQPWLRNVLFPLSLLYAMGVHIRNFFYDKGIFSSLSYATPTVCVGNLSVGGTGKTPMIEYIIRLLEGYNIAVLSRGYKRKSKGFVRASRYATVEDVGDEPFQLYQKFPTVTVAVDADRRNGIAQLEATVKPEIILLDDAFQHRSVTPTFSLLLTAYDTLFVNDWYLPTGNLRDSKKEAKRATMIVVTKCPESLSDAKRKAITQKLQPQPHQQVLFSYLVYENRLKGGSNPALTLPELRGRKVALVTGIAAPGPLVRYLISQKIDFQHFKYPDHHTFTEQDLGQFRHFPMVLTTEKDYVRLKGKVKQLYYVEVAHQFTTADRAILEKNVTALL